MNDLDITKGEWKSTVHTQLNKSEIRVDGNVIAVVSSPNANCDAAVMASAPKIYDVLTDILIYLRNPNNRNNETSREWSDIQRRVNDIIGTLPKK